MRCDLTTWSATNLLFWKDKDHSFHMTNFGKWQKVSDTSIFSSLSLGVINQYRVLGPETII